MKTVLPEGRALRWCFYSGPCAGTSAKRQPRQPETREEETLHPRKSDRPHSLTFVVSHQNLSPLDPGQPDENI